MASPEISPNEPGGRSQFPATPVQRQSEQPRFQMIWDEQMKDTTPYVRYRRTAALLVSWDDQVDDLKTQHEVNGLATVFKDLYCFETTMKRLDHNKRAQLQMNYYLAQFLHEHDERHALLIIYYAGHGFSDKSSEGTLRLHGSTSQAMQKQLERNTVVWENAEKLIEKAEADVLLIFDCCQAGVLARNRSGSRFQVLGACTADETTKPPGPTSFTSALIWALNELHKRDFFPLTELRDRITQAPNFPRSQIPVIVDRFRPSLDYIFIAPMRENVNPHSGADSQSIQDDLGGEYLNLRFYFSHKLGEEEFTQVAEEINRLLLDKRVKARRVAFLGKYSFPQKTCHIARRWRENVNRRKSPVVPRTGDFLTVNTTADDSQQSLSTETAVSSEIISPRPDRNSAQRERKRTTYKRAAKRVVAPSPVIGVTRKGVKDHR